MGVKIPALKKSTSDCLKRGATSRRHENHAHLRISLKKSLLLLSFLLIFSSSVGKSRLQKKVKSQRWFFLQRNFDTSINFRFLLRKKLCSRPPISSPTEKFLRQMEFLFLGNGTADEMKKKGAIPKKGICFSTLIYGIYVRQEEELKSGLLPRPSIPYGGGRRAAISASSSSSSRMWTLERRRGEEDFPKSAATNKGEGEIRRRYAHLFFLPGVASLLSLFYYRV